MPSFRAALNELKKKVADATPDRRLTFWDAVVGTCTPEELSPSDRERFDDFVAQMTGPRRMSLEEEFGLPPFSPSPSPPSDH